MCQTVPLDLMETAERNASTGGACERAGGGGSGSNCATPTGASAAASASAFGSPLISGLRPRSTGDWGADFGVQGSAGAAAAAAAAAGYGHGHGHGLKHGGWGHGFSFGASCWSQSSIGGHSSHDEEEDVMMDFLQPSHGEHVALGDLLGECGD